MGGFCSLCAAQAGKVVDPSEFGWDGVDVPGLLHYGIVDGDLCEGGVELVNDGLLLVGEESRGNLVHDGCDLWSMLA